MQARSLVYVVRMRSEGRQHSWDSLPTEEDAFRTERAARDYLSAIGEDPTQVRVYPVMKVRAT